MNMELGVNVWTWLLAFFPLALLLVMMIGRQWGAAEAGPLAWIVAVVVAAIVFGMPFTAIGLESVKGTWSAITILYVVWPAILIYEVTREAGAFDPFRKGITRLLPHPLLQVLAFGWAFASFLQGVTGFGVPIAVCAPLLVGIGVRPLYAVVIPLVGHAWNNTFGTLGVAWLGLKQVTEMGPELAASAALFAASFIWILNFLGGILVCWIYGRMQGIREGLPVIIPLSLAHGGLTLVLSQWNDTLNGFIAGIVGFLLIFALGRLPLYRRPSAVKDSRIFEPGHQEAEIGAERPADVTSPVARRGVEDTAAVPPAAPATVRAEASPQLGTAPDMSLGKAFIPYFALLALTFGVLLTPLRDLLGFVTFGLSFPGFTTDLGFEREPATQSISILTHAGTFLFASAFIGYAAYKSMGYIGKGGWRRVWAHTLDKAIASTIAVVALVAMSTVMQGAGQANALAEGVAAATGDFYGFLAPFVGLLGAFMTSSNLASNLLFGTFQESTAQAAGLDRASILGAQTAGGAVGNTIAPGNVLLGTTTAGILGREGEVLKITLPLGLLISLVIGVVVLIVA